MGNDSGFDRQLWRDDGRNAENGGHIPTLVIVAPDAPREALLGLGTARAREHFHVTLPCHFAPENLFNGYRFKVRGVAAMDGFNRLAKLWKVVAHGLESATRSSTFHKREDTPSAMAGVQRIVECVFTKL